MPEENEWQPIETAPQTGRTLLLGYWNSHGNWRTVRGQWMSAGYIAEFWEEPDDVEEGWFETSAEADEATNCWPITPSHWMPLPAAPGVEPAASRPAPPAAERAPVGDERVAFEAWMASQNLGLLRDGDSYSLTYARRAWDSWQARAALARTAVASAEVMDALNWVDDFIARCNRDDRGSCESVNILRRALASTPLPAPIQWPTMPESKGQSPVLFEDGYAEGWAKCMDECRRALVAVSNYIDKLGGDSKTYRAALASAPAHGDAIDTSPKRVDETANDQHGESAPVSLSETERTAIAGLIAVARAAFSVADDAEDDGAAYQVKVSRADVDALGEALDTLDELPDDQPGYSMGPSNKAEWALRRLLSTASAPVAGEAKPVAWRYQTPTGWHATTDAEKAVRVGTHHPLEPLYAAPQASPAADGRDAKDETRKTAGNIQEPMNGDGWHVVWWNESMRLMLPDGSRLDRFQGYRNGTMQLTIKTDAAIAAQQGEGGGV